MSRCPGQDMRNWGYDAIFEIDCPKCHDSIEFFKDEIKHRCRGCGEVVFNDRIDLGCAKWCPSAESCVGPEILQALQFSEQQKARREAFKLLLEMVADEAEHVRNLFKTLYSEYSGEDKLFDTNRLYTVKENDPELFEAASSIFKSYLVKVDDKSNQLMRRS